MTDAGRQGGAAASGPPGWEPIRTRAVWVRRVLLAIAAIDVLAVAAGVGQYVLLGRIEAGEAVSDAAVDESDTRVAVVAIVQVAAYLTAMVLFIRWFHRAYRNLPALGASGIRFRPGWAIGGWFVPILGLWRPKQIANDIWRASDPDRPTGQGMGWQEAAVPTLLGLWWAAFLLENWLGNIAFRLSIRGGDEIPDLERETVVFALSDLVGIAGALLAAEVVRRTTARQEERAARLAGGPPSGAEVSEQAAGEAGTASAEEGGGPEQRPAEPG